MSDGNIIVAASPSNDNETVIHFRIHSSVLLLSSVLAQELDDAVRSDVLRVGDENLSLLERQAGGVRFVHLKEPAEELKHLFDIFYKPL